MNILVTGGAGFIGGHLAEAFVADGHSVRAIDCLFDNYAVNIKRRTIERARDVAAETAGRYRFVEGDILNREVVDEQLAWADVVFHQAARAGVRQSVEDPLTYNEVNVNGTLNVLDAAREHDVQRVVCASSSSVYGKPEYLPYDETHPTTPISPYGVSKLAAEQYTRMYYDTYDLPTVILRYFTVYGPRMRPNMAISNFVSRCFCGEPPVVYGDGSQTRDFTYIDDIVAANRALLDRSDADGEIMNVGSSDNISIRELATEIRDQISPDLPLEFADRYDADAEHTHADVSKARERIGYEPSTTIREGVSAFIDWYDRNRDWYEPLVRE
jgi:UDP-glucose 4-epimerase